MAFSIVTQNEQELFDRYKDEIQEQSRKQIEDEIMKVAANNWPKAIKALIRKFKDVELNLDTALIKINERVDYQLRTVGNNDGYTDVLWTLLQTKKYTDKESCYALGVAMLLENSLYHEAIS